jgi:hypothetical protein
MAVVGGAGRGPDRRALCAELLRAVVPDDHPDHGGWRAGLNILTGYTGLISLGHVGFLVTGAYAYAVLVSKYQMHPLVGFLGAGVVPALASLIVGAPSLRLKGLYLADHHAGVLLHHQHRDPGSAAG